MPAGRIFVVVREIEKDRRDFATFFDPEDAAEYYEEAYSLCLDGPGDSAGDDQTVVTNCWLYEANIDCESQAVELAADGIAVLIRSFDANDASKPQ